MKSQKTVGMRARTSGLVTSAHLIFHHLLPNASSPPVSFCLDAATYGVFLTMHAGVLIFDCLMGLVCSFKRLYQQREKNTCVAFIS